jgi:hypothetical protein
LRENLNWLIVHIYDWNPKFIQDKQFFLGSVLESVVVVVFQSVFLLGNISK